MENLGKKSINSERHPSTSFLVLPPPAKFVLGRILIWGFSSLSLLYNHVSFDFLVSGPCISQGFSRWSLFTVPDGIQCEKKVK